MPEKQLNFLNIFDEEKELKENVLNLENSDNEDNDPVAFNSSEGVARAEADKQYNASMQKEKRDEIERRRVALLLKSEPTLADFEEYLPEIKSYSLRMQGFREAHKTAPQSEKMFWYERMVRPDKNDEVEFRDSARMYLKYIEAYNEEQKIKRGNSMYEPARKAEQTTKTKTAKKLTPKFINNNIGKSAAAMLDK